MSKALQHLKFLAVTIGPRGSATPQEAEAADYIEKELAEMGLSPLREPFKSVTSFSWPFLLIYALFPLAAVLFRIRPWLGLASSCLGLLLFYAESNTFPVLSSLLPKRSSQNIRAVVEPRSKALRRVVLSAHYDSSRSAWNFSPSMVKNFRRSFLTMLGSMILIALLYFIGLFCRSWRGPLWALSLFPVLYLLGTIGFLIHREIKGQYTHGANDNASGVSVLLEVARALAKFPPLTVRVEILATGCEEAGTVGMIQYFRRHHVDRGTFFINLDNLGAGRLAVTTREGIIGGKPSSPELLDVARQACKDKNLPVDFRPYALLTTDATAAMMRGFGAVSIMAFDEQGLLPHWHWETDVFDNVNPENLENAKELVLGMLRRLEQ